MPRFTRHYGRWAGATLLLVGSAYALAQAGGLRLTLNGNVASTSVRMLDGRPYVPVADMAKALNMSVAKRAGGYEIVKAGGANQVEGLQGKVGDTLFDGRWRFTVIEAKPVDSYTMQSPSIEPITQTSRDVTSYDTRTRVLTPAEGYKLFLVQCRVSNGQHANHTLWTALQDVHTAIADEAGQSYQPVAYDFVGAPIQTQSMLPGAKMEFPMLFCLPEKSQPKDLVFTLHNNDFSEKGTDVRVSLSKP